MANKAQEALTMDELEALLAAIVTRGPAGRRNIALVMLMADSGLRVGEALALETRDVVTEAGQITGVKVRNGKGGKAANVPVPSRTAVALAKWLEAREALEIEPGAVFCTISKGRRSRGRATSAGFAEGTETVELTPGNAISDRYVRQLVTRLAERAGLEGRVTPHTLRHTFATHLLRETGNLKLTQQALRHSDVTTTARVYSHLTDNDVGDAVRALRDEEPADEEPDAKTLDLARALMAAPKALREELAAIIHRGDDED